MSGLDHRVRISGVAVILAAALVLTACGAGGMARAVTKTGEGFDRGECLSEQFRTGEPCDQGQFSDD
ncbi:MAG: hypothetical protein ACK4R3_03105 [Aliihoeflea sp.]